MTYNVFGETLNLTQLRLLFRTLSYLSASQCWLGRSTRKKPVPHMTYNVFVGTLNFS